MLLKNSVNIFLPLSLSSKELKRTLLCLEYLRMDVYFLPRLCLNQRVTCSDLLHLHHAVVDSPSSVRAFLVAYFLAVHLNKTMQYRDGFFPLTHLPPSFLPPLHLPQ